METDPEVYQTSPLSIREAASIVSLLSRVPPDEQAESIQASAHVQHAVRRLHDFTEMMNLVTDA